MAIPSDWTRLDAVDLEVRGGQVRLAEDPGTLGGSVLTFDVAVANMVTRCGVLLLTALRAAALPPASPTRAPQKGHLVKGPTPTSSRSTRPLRRGQGRVQAACSRPLQPVDGGRSPPTPGAGSVECEPIDQERPSTTRHRPLLSAEPPLRDRYSLRLAGGVRLETGPLPNRQAARVDREVSVDGQPVSGDEVTSCDWLARARDREQIPAHGCYTSEVRSVDRFPAVAGEASRRCSGWPCFLS